MTLVIRRATGEDLAGAAELHRQVHELHLQARPDQFRQVDSATTEARLRELLASPDAKVWIAELGNTVVGYAVGIHQRRAAVGALIPAREWCEIDQIGVAPEERRHGVARTLIQAIVDDARASGLRDVELSSWAFNTEAHAAFEKLGFAAKVIRFELKR